MFNTSTSLESLNNWGKGNMLEHLGIEFIELTSTSLKAKMPVDHRTKQPFGLLSTLAVEDPKTQIAVGVEINANHLKSVKGGYVIGTCTPLRIVRTMHVYEIKIHDEHDNLVCASRLTVAILLPK